MLRLFVLLLAVGVPIAAHAQAPAPATRAEALRQEREKKQQQLRPNEPDRLQRAVEFIETRGLFLVPKDGFYPKFGSLTTGGGWAFGVGFRDRDMFRKRGTLDLWTAASLRRYWAMEARARFPDLAAGRLMAEGVATLREYPREDFFGVGPDSRRPDRTRFLLRQSHVYGRAALQLNRLFSVGGSLGLLQPRTDGGKGQSVPSIRTLFTPATVPALGESLNFIRSSANVVMDYRDVPNARRGGLYRVEHSRYTDTDGGAWSFGRTDIDLQQFVGFLADRRVLALRGLVSTSDATGSRNAMPFFLMPSLGGNTTLRGFRNYRFRGPHALLLQAEYRWELWSGLDAALFYDSGKVTMERRDLNFNKLEKDYGFGFRFNTSNGVLLRVDAAFGSADGKHLHIVFGGAF